MQREVIPSAEHSWRRIPDGVRVRHQTNGDEGMIDGITQIVEGPRRNPDRLTQYRIDVGGSTRKLAAEEELLIVVDDGGLVVMLKQPAEYRQFVTAQLRMTWKDDRFVKKAGKSTKEATATA
jgi:hypothetical protein